MYPTIAAALARQGSSIYGAYVSAFLVVAVLVPLQRVSLSRFLDGAAPSLALGEALTRIGCFCAGCCYGVPWDGPWAVRFPAGSFALYDLQVRHVITDGAATQTPALHPVQLYGTAVMLLVTVALIWWLFRRRRHDGEVFALFLVAYGAQRLALAAFRMEVLASMKLFSAVFIAAGVVGFVLARYRPIAWSRLPARAWREKLVVSSVLVIAVVAVFMAAQRLSASTASHSEWPALAMDAHIPFVPEAVWVYASWYAAPLLVLGCGRRQFRRTAAAALVAFVLCALGWITFPAAITRPELGSSTGWSAGVLHAVYAIDPPGNLFPSFHAALAAILIGVRFDSRTRRLAMAGWMTAIWLSCVLTKQHYAVDVVGGIAAGVVAMASVWCGETAVARGRLDASPTLSMAAGTYRSPL